VAWAWAYRVVLALPCVSVREHVRFKRLARTSNIYKPTNLHTYPAIQYTNLFSFAMHFIDPRTRSYVQYSSSFAAACAKHTKSLEQPLAHQAPLWVGGRGTVRARMSIRASFVGQVIDWTQIAMPTLSCLTSEQNVTSRHPLPWHWSDRTSPRPSVASSHEGDWT
jgi:hypothetical protein